MSHAVPSICQRRRERAKEPPAGAGAVLSGSAPHVRLANATGSSRETAGRQTNSASVFGYDDLCCWTSATVNGASYGWVYDHVGDMFSQTAGGVTTSYAYNAADQLTAVNGAAVTSDLDGNVISDDTGGLYTWDARGRLTGLTKGGSSYGFQYGPDNLRVGKTVNGVLTTYLLDGNQVVTDTIGGSANQTLYGPGTDHPLARNGEFFLPNHESSTTGLTDGSGNLTQSYLYGPFGELLNSPTDSNPFQYTGRENDGDGLLYYRARYYCPAWGRFVSADPLGVGGPRQGTDAPPTRLGGVSPYAYADDNPVNATDPSGTLPVPGGARGVSWWLQVLDLFLNLVHPNAGLTRPHPGGRSVQVIQRPASGPYGQAPAPTTPSDPVPTGNDPVTNPTPPTAPEPGGTPSGPVPPEPIPPQLPEGPGGVRVRIPSGGWTRNVGSGAGIAAIGTIVQGLGVGADGVDAVLKYRNHWALYLNGDGNWW